MLEDVHGRDHVEGLGRQRRGLQVDEGRRQSALGEAPPGEPQEGRADVRQAGGQAMLSEEDRAGTEARAEVQMTTAVVPAREVERHDIGERRGVVTQRVPPPEVEDVSLVLTVDTT